MSLVSVSGAAKVLGVTARAARNLHESGALPAEATVSGVAVWRTESLKEWDRLGRQPGRWPTPAPSSGLPVVLEVYGVEDIASLFGVSVSLIKKLRYQKRIVPPTWTVGAGTMVWSLEDLERMTPDCDGHKVDWVDTDCRPGVPCLIECSCGRWTTLRLDGK